MPSSRPASPQVVPVETPVALDTVQHIVQVIQAQQPEQPASLSITINMLAVPAHRSVTPGQRIVYRLGVIGRSRWMPWYPFSAMGRRHWTRWQAVMAAYPGLMKPVFLIAVATCIAASTWRSAALPLSILGGVLAFLVIAARTGMLTEIGSALEEAGGMPPTVTVLHTMVRWLPGRLISELRALSVGAETAAARMSSRRALGLYASRALRLRRPSLWKRTTQHETDTTEGGAIS